MARSDNMRGSLYLVSAMAAFSCGDAVSKSLIAVMNAGEILFLRGLITSTLVFLLARHMGALRSWRVMLQPMIALRILCEAVSTITYMTALGMIPIANASAVTQALPLVVTLGAAIFLKEPVGWRRWSAIAVGFVGVLVILRPGPDGFSTGALFVVASICATATRDLATRRIDKSVPSLMVTVCTATSITLFGAVAMVPLGGWHTPSPAAFSHICIGAVAVLIGYQCAVMAMRTGEISFVAPFRYFSLIFAALLGLVFFGEFPDDWTMIGAAIVIASGLYTLYREAKRRRATLVALQSEPRVSA